jgi:hypothetical protein
MKRSGIERYGGVVGMQSSGEAVQRDEAKRNRALWRGSGNAIFFESVKKPAYDWVYLVSGEAVQDFGTVSADFQSKRRMGKAEQLSTFFLLLQKMVAYIQNYDKINVCA